MSDQHDWAQKQKKVPSDVITSIASTLCISDRDGLKAKKKNVSILLMQALRNVPFVDRTFGILGPQQVWWQVG
jgi:hypothetical protein